VRIAKQIQSLVRNSIDWIVERLPALIHREHSGNFNYLFVLIMMGIALLVRLAIAPVNAGLQYVAFFPAVTLAAVIGGIWPGIFATVIGLCLATFIFIPPYYSVSIEVIKTGAWPNLVFLIDGIIVCSSIEAMHRYRARYAKELKEARQSEQTLMQYAAIIDSSDDAIITKSLDGVITSWNRGAERIYGYSLEEVKGRHISLLIPEQYLDEESRLLKQVRAGIFVNHYETVRRRKDGKLIDISVTLSPIRDGDENIIGASKVARDITKRKANQLAMVRNEANLRAVMNNSPYLTWLKDMDGHYLMINNVYASYLQLKDPLEAIGKTDLQLHPKDMAEKYRADDNEVMTSRKQKHVEESIFDGKSFQWMETYKTPIIDAHGNVHGTVGFSKDISVRKKMEQELRIAATTFETHDAIVITDADGDIIKVNRAFTSVTGYSQEEVLGKNPRIMNSGRHDRTFFTEIFETLQRDGSWAGEIWDKRKNGEIYPRWMTITAIRDPQQILTHYVGIFSDITDRKKNEELISNMAFYDTLTQLPNRRLLNDRLGKAMAANKRSGNYGAVMFMDLDNFKPLNDLHGHAVGDLLLIEVARRISNCVREMDTVARFGGDEFVVMISELDIDESQSREEARIVADKILQSLAETYHLTLHSGEVAEVKVEHHCTASIGVTLFINHESSQDEVLKRADMAMYQAKESGRNTICFYGAE